MMIQVQEIRKMRDETDQLKAHVEVLTQASMRREQYVKYLSAELAAVKSQMTLDFDQELWN